MSNPVTPITLTQAHWDWWASLTPLWQKIFLVNLYHKDEIITLYDEDGFSCDSIGGNKYYEFEYSGSFVRSKSLTDFKQPEDLAKLFALTHLFYENEFPASFDIAVTTVPSLKYFVAMKKIYLCDNYLENISGLVEATHLEKIVLHDNDLTHLPDMHHLTKLRHLDVSLNDLTNVSLFAKFDKLPHLTELSIWGNQITDITPVAKLSQLKTLNASCNKIDKLPDMSELTGLTELNLEDNMLTDFTPLDVFDSHTMIEIAENPTRGL